MDKFDINKVIEHWGVNAKELAYVLFGDLKYPAYAMDRVMAGESFLDSNQLVILAEYLGVKVSDLYNLDSWKGITDKGRIAFQKGPYKVSFRYGNSVAVIFKNNEFLTEFLVTPNCTPVSDFINLVDNIIKQCENGTN